MTNYHSSWQDVGTATSYSIQGTYNTAYSIQVRAVSAGQTSDVRTSNSATPLPNLPPSYTLCYHNDYGNEYNVGINYSNSGAGHTLGITFAQSSGVTTGANGQLRLRAWTKRTTSGDLNTQMTLTLDGAAYSTTRWGDAPPC